MSPAWWIPLLTLAAWGSGDAGARRMGPLQAEILRLPRVPPALPPPPPAPAADRVLSVYGYWPYWGSDVENLAWDHITHLAIMGVEMEADGSLSGVSTWTGNAPAAIQAGHAAGVKIHLCVYSFTPSVMEAVFGSETRRATLVAELASLVAEVGADGVNVDVEGLPTSVRDAFVGFVRDLRAAVGEVWLATPAVDWVGAYDYSALAEASDGLFIMGYAFYYTGGPPGPNDPLYGSNTWGSYSLQWSVEDYLRFDARRDRVTLGLPLYGQEWPTTGTDVPGTATDDGWSVTFAEAVAEAAAHGRLYDPASACAYTFPSTRHQIWYDDTETLRERIAYARDMGLQGVGFWAMSYEANDPAFWAMVDEETLERGGGEGDDTDDSGRDEGPVDGRAGSLEIAGCACGTRAGAAAGGLVPLWGLAAVLARRTRRGNPQKGRTILG